MEKLAKDMNFEFTEKDKWFFVTGDESQPKKGNEHENYPAVPFLTLQICKPQRI